MFFRATLIAAAIATATVGWALPTNAPTGRSGSTHREKCVVAQRP